MNWHETGTVAPRSLAAARLQLHHGALVLGSAAHSVLPHADDDSHTNLGWNPRHRSFCTHPLVGDRGMSLHLDLPTFALVLRGDTEELGSLRLPGKTLADALAWVASQLEPALGAAVRIAPREYPDFPASPIIAGGAFDQPEQACVGELARWFGNASGLFAQLRAVHPTMTEARIWPHHFDLGALIPLPGGRDRAIGVGLSPGDKHYGQPYFYCSPYPQPAAVKNLPALGVGQWHTQGFVSAVLTATGLHGRASQWTIAQRHLTEAIVACRTVVTGRPA